MREALFTIRNRLDGAGILISGLCILHCLAGALVVSVLGISGGALMAHGVHEAGLAVAGAIAMLTLGLGAMRHRQRVPLLIGAGGIALMGAALVIPHGSGEAVLTVIGVTIVAFAHILNMRHS